MKIETYLICYGWNCSKKLLYSQTERSDYRFFLENKVIITSPNGEELKNDNLCNLNWQRTKPVMEAICEGRKSNPNTTEELALFQLLKHTSYEGTSRTLTRTKAQ